MNMIAEDWVYFAFDGRCVKIGHSKDPKKRVRSISTISNTPLELIRLEPGGRKLEKWFHKKFKHLQSSNEWFWYSEELLTVPAPEVICRPDATVKRRDVRLTLKERLKEVIGNQKELQLSPNQTLLLIAQSLKKDEASELLDVICERSNLNFSEIQPAWS